MKDLGTLGGVYSSPVSINEKGSVNMLDVVILATKFNEIVVY